MPRPDSTPGLILQRIKARLIDQITGATDSTCWITDDPDAVPSPSPADIWYTISPEVSGKFDEGLFVGGGQSQVTVETAIAVTVHNIQMLDEVGRTESFFTNANLGILPAAKPVLQALAGHDLEDEDSNRILAQPLLPSYYNIHRDTTNRRGSILLAFKVVFDWDMS